MNISKKQPTEPAIKDKALRRGSPRVILDTLDKLDFSVPDSLRKRSSSIKEDIAELRDRDLTI